MTTRNIRTPKSSKTKTGIKRNETKSLESESLDVTISLSPATHAAVSWSSSEGSSYYSDEVDEFSQRDTCLKERRPVECRATLKPLPPPVGSGINPQSLKAASSGDGHQYTTPKPFSRTSPSKTNIGKEVKFKCESRANRRKDLSSSFTTSAWKNVLKNVDFYHEVDTTRSKGEMSEVRFLSKEDTHEIFCKRLIPVVVSTAERDMHDDISPISSTVIGSTTWQSDSEQAMHAHDKDYSKWLRSAAESVAKSPSGRSVRSRSYSKSRAINGEDFMAVTCIGLLDQVTISSLESESSADDVRLDDSASDMKNLAENVTSNPKEKCDDNFSTVQERNNNVGGVYEKQKMRCTLDVAFSNAEHSLTRESSYAAKTDERIMQLKEKIKRIREASMLLQTLHSDVESNPKAASEGPSSSKKGTTGSSAKEESGSWPSPSTLSGDTSTNEAGVRSHSTLTMDASQRNSDDVLASGMASVRFRENKYLVNASITESSKEGRNEKSADALPFVPGFQETDLSMQPQLKMAGNAAGRTTSAGIPKTESATSIPFEIPIGDMEEISLFGCEAKHVLHSTFEVDNVLFRQNSTRHDVEAGLSHPSPEPFKVGCNENLPQSQRFRRRAKTDTFDIPNEFKKLLLVGRCKAMELSGAASRWIDATRSEIRAKSTKEQIVIAFIVVGIFSLLVLLIALATNKG